MATRSACWLIVVNKASILTGVPRRRSRFHLSRRSGRRDTDRPLHLPKVARGRTWDDARDEVADLMIDTVDRVAPNFKASILGRRALSPLDLEREFGLTGGDIFHGALTLDQLFSARPVLGHGNYRAPLPGLYLCGAGTHPGGGVTGVPGHNAAREILKDVRRRKF